jgi:multicomponent Na+:H+ antiporter subunit E
MNLFVNLALNFVLAAIWLFVTESYSTLNFAVGLVVGYIGIGLTDPGYAARVWRGIFFAFYVAFQIIKSALTVTATVLNFNSKPRSGIIAVPLDIDSHAEIIMLATVITLTPGTISVETGWSSEGKRVLFVHCLLLDDPDDMRRSIKHDFERRIIGFMQPVHDTP